MASNFFTQKGYQELEDEKARLLTERETAISELQRARELGDLSENGLYKAAKAQLGHLDHRLEELEYFLKTAKIIEKSNTETISMGSKVTIQSGDQPVTYQIVGKHEANSLEGKISDFSPLGKLLLGKKVGDEVTVTTSQSQTLYRILSIV